MIMYEAFRSGADASVERAAIGRRVSETEIDLINLVGGRACMINRVSLNWCKR